MFFEGRGGTEGGCGSWLTLSMSEVTKQYYRRKCVESVAKQWRDDWSMRRGGEGELSQPHHLDGRRPLSAMWHIGQRAMGQEHIRARPQSSESLDLSERRWQPDSGRPNQPIDRRPTIACKRNVRLASSADTAPSNSWAEFISWRCEYSAESGM